MQALSRDKSTTLHNRNLQHLAIEMYELKNNISPHALIDFIAIKETNYESRFCLARLDERCKSLQLVQSLCK